MEVVSNHCSEHIPLQIRRVSNNDPQERTENIVRLKPKLTLLNGCTLIIGSVIGSGIFVAPNTILRDAGNTNLSLLL